MTSPQITHTGLIDLILQAGPVVKLIMFALLLTSIYCWAIVATKWRSLKRAVTEDEKFLNAFWNGKNIDEVLARSEKFTSSPVAAVFRSGVKELKKLNTDKLPASGLEVDNIHRALTRASSSEISKYEKQVGVLATTASSAPFVGLFGTVWGIMNSFQNIGATGGANLAVVAPGISEALIATAIGLAAAIPASIAYNHFVAQIRRIATDMECFSQDFLNIVQRSMIAGSPRKEG